MEENLMELLPNQNWDSITNNLRQYDRADMNLKKETANAATIDISCYGCGQTGRKRPDCPNKGKGKGNNRGRGNGSGKGGEKVFLEAVDNKDIGGIKVEVEGVVKKVVKANHHLTVTSHVPATFVISRVIFRTAVHMQKNFNKC